MRRIVSLMAAAAMLVALPPLSSDPADAAVGRRRIIACEGCWPTAFAFTPNGRTIYYVERFSGAIRTFNLHSKRNRLWGRVGGVSTSGEQGLLGIALDPRWPKQPWVYVSYTRREPLQNRILALRKRGDGSTARRQVATMPAAGFHNGGIIHAGPDGRLWAVTGDVGEPSRAQDVRNRAGKVLRMRLNGKRPADNPFPGLAFSYGHRNSYGFTFDPKTGRPWQSENGPTCGDEINRIRKGRNFGWGPGSDECESTGRTRPVGDRPVGPAKTYDPVPALTGTAFCERCGLGARIEGTLLVGAWNSGQIRSLRLNDRRTTVAGDSLLHTNGTGVLSVERHPSGPVYFSDPNGIYRLVRR